MSGHKNIDRICIIGLVLTLLVTIAFMNGKALGIVSVKDEDTERFADSAYFTNNDQDGDWKDNAYTSYVNLTDGKIDGNGAYFLNGDLVISEAGWYELSGVLDGNKIVVDAHNTSKVWIRLDGVTVTCEDDACLRVDQADKVFLTLAEGSENCFSSGASYSQDALDDGTGGTIFSHDDLTINGSGSLLIDAAYKHGIDANDSLVITGGTIRISAVQDGIHVNDSFRFMGAALTIDAGDDGIHCDKEVYVESGTIAVNSCYEGIEGVTIDVVGGEISIYPTDDGMNANGGSAFGGRMMQQESQEVEEETYIRISGGKVTIINESGRDADGLDSNGDIYIEGGEVFVSLPGEGGNCAVDYGSESGGRCVISGGTTVACGDGSMAEAFSENCTQCAVLYNFEQAFDGGTSISVLDENEAVILTYTPPCSFSSVALSCPELTQGESYTLLIGEQSYALSLEQTAITLGIGGGMGGFGGFGHQMAQGDTEGFTPPQQTDEQRPMRGAFDGAENKMHGEFDGQENQMRVGRFGQRMNGEMPDGTEMPDMQNGTELPEMQNGTPPFAEQQEAAEAAETSEQGAELDRDTLLMLGICAAVLLAALVAAKLYKKA